MHRAAERVSETLGRSSGPVRRASRHDLVLAFIPAAFLAAAALGTTLSVSATAAVTAAALVSAVAVGDALFRNPPRGPSSNRPPG